MTEKNTAKSKRGWFLGICSMALIVSSFFAKAYETQQMNSGISVHGVQHIV